MTISTEIKQNWKEDKLHLQNSIISLRQSFIEFKTLRKTEWKSFKTKFHDDQDKVEKLLKELNIRRKKQN